MKTNIATRLSLRAKFKSFELVELCIIDSETGEVQLEQIPVKVGKEFPEQAETESKEEVPAEKKVEQIDSEKGEVVDDTDSDENGRVEGK